MQIENYGTQPPIKGVCKSSAVWARQGGAIFPLIYLQRPKWIKNDEAWKKVVESVRIALPVGFEIT